MGAGICGCVVDLGNGHVAKVFFRERDGLKEHEVASKLQMIDQTNRYTPKYFGKSNIICGPILEFLVHVIKCKCSPKIDETPYIITYENAGIDLACYFTKVIQPASFESLLSSWKPILEGILELNAADVIHGDIKPSNLICNKDRKIVLTDFGVACSKQNFWDRVSFAAKCSYAYYPPELMLCIASSKEDIDVDQLTKRFSDQYIKEYVDEIDVLLLVGYFHNLYTVNGCCTTPIEMYDRLNHETMQLFQRPYSDCFDTFSVGMTLYECYQFALENHCVSNKEWCEINVIPIIKQMCNPLLTERIQINDAIKKWDNTLVSYNKAIVQ